LNAVCKGTPRSGGICHITVSGYNATPKRQTHIQSSNDCAACHNTISFRPDVHFDHREAMGSCVSCHNGTIAQGKGPTHPQTSDACDACHTTLSWNPPKAVDHTQIPLAVQGFCIICHNGTSATGKNKGHLVTSLECGDCHLTTTWLGANFDHTGIKTGCFSCHNGVKAVGKQGNHMPTSNVCETCHTTGLGTAAPNWVPSLFVHTQMSVQTCATCHSGTVKISTGFVSGSPMNHVPLVASAPDCGVCHGNTPTAETWTVLAASIPTLHSGLPVTNCILCHAGQTFAGVPAPYIPMSISGISPTKKTPLAPPHIPILAGTDCSACHGAAYTAGGFGPATAMSAAKHAFVSKTCDVCHDTGKSFYVGGGTPLQLRPANHVNSTDPSMATGDCSQCHTTTDWNSNAMPAGHMPNPSNLTCVTCHASAPNDYTPATLAANSKLHTGITGKCGLCHGDNVTALTWANNYTPKDAILTPPHIPYISGTDCSSCHSATTYAVGTFGPMNMTSAKHAFVPTACDTCHEAGLSFYMGAATPALQGRPADHMAPTGTAQQQTGDCSGCHTTANWNSNLMPAGHMPNPGNQACSVCHTAIGATAASYATLASIAVLHTGISGNCGLCHGSPSGALTFYNNNDPIKAAVLSPVHIPYLTGTDCSSCHATNYVAGGFGPTNMSAAKHAFVPTTCDTCHDGTTNFYLGASTPATIQKRPANHISAPNPPSQATGDCSLCHNTTVWTTPTTLPNGHMPIPGTQTCSVCHTGNLSTIAGYATMASIPVLHTGITTGCAQCHGGATALTFYNNNDNPKAAASLSPPHIPSFTNNDCSACHKANYVVGGFGPMNMTQATHANVSATPCKTCHEAGLSFYMGAASPGLQGRPADHSSGTMLTGDCGGCHNTANWNSTALPSGHMPNPGNQTCNVCHTSAPSNYKVFASNAVLHTGITGNCSQCHGAGTQLSFYNNDMVIKDNVLTPPHIPYLSGTDCGSCHKSTTHAPGTFGPMNMTQATHAFVATTCKTCHGTATVAFYMGAANPKLQLRPADHTTGTMLTGDCSGCHTTANWNSGTLPANHMPNPANQACATCHTAAPANYTTLASNAILHTGIVSGCITCHGAPNAAKPVYATNFSPKAASGLSPPHLPSAATPCESCHTATVFTAFSGTTMSSAKHTQLLAHTGGTCDQCHDATTLAFYGVTNLQHRPNGHHAGKDCNGCHGTNNWNNAQVRKTAAAPATTKTTVSVVANTGLAGRSANGGLLSQSGVQLRGGGVAGGIAGSVALATGGTSVAGAPSLMGITRINHAGVVANCFSCHNGALAAGKGPRHIASNNSCENCHTTLAWIPAHFDHRGLTATCASCHNGAAAPGKPARHIQTNQDCSACHGTIAWAPATFNHLGINATCQSCHNGVAATTKQIGHIPTTRDCGSCHSTLNWTTTTIPPAPLKPLISRPKPSPRPPGAINGPAK